MQLNPTAIHWGDAANARARRQLFRAVVHGLFWPLLIIVAMSGRI
ncbi:MAG TPA: hypothetical protein VFB90_02295 [Dehalococcoidia bacterium]|nr:hypothetical protein [Dehalococcoidia bacterium]